MAKENETVERYPRSVQEKFRPLLLEKIAKAKEAIKVLRGCLSNENGTDETHKSHEVVEYAVEQTGREDNKRLIDRQLRIIASSENALLRIDNGTFGTCRVTHKLISLERLGSVPHATTSIEAKLNEPPKNGKKHPSTTASRVNRKSVNY